MQRKALLKLLAAQWQWAVPLTYPSQIIDLEYSERRTLPMKAL
jgi:hypothetical protein